MIKDFITGIGSDALKDRLGETYDQMRIKAELEKYVEKNEKQNYSCTREEEIDFQGLADYLCKQLPKEVENRIFGNRAERSRAHHVIVAKAIEYSCANTAIAQKRVRKFVNDALSILSAFWDKKLSRELRYLGAKITDDVDDVIKNRNNEQTQTIIEAMRDLAEENRSTTPLDLNVNRTLLKDGNIGQVEENIKDFIKSLSTQHQLFPHYGYSIRSIGLNPQLISTPLNADAEKIYPPHFKCSGRIFVGDKQVSEITPQMKQYADDHQLPITLIADEAQKFLGDIIDPQQCEIDEIVGQPVVIPPKPFPAAMPYSIIHDGMIIYEHILLRTEEKFEDGSFIISNKEQNLPFFVRFKVSPATKTTSFSLCIDGGSNQDQLKYREFLQRLYSGGCLVIRHLDTGKSLLEASCTEKRPQEYMDDLRTEIEFLKNVISIENYFEEQIILPEHFSEEDTKSLNYAAALIQGKTIRGEWLEYTIRIPVEETMKEKVLEYLESPHSLTYHGTKTVSFFGRSYNLSCLCTWLPVKLAAPAKVKTLLNTLDFGEEINLHYIPGSNDGKGVFIEQLDTDTKSHS